MREASSLAVLFLSVCFDVRLEEICLTLERSLGMGGGGGYGRERRSNRGLIMYCLNRSFQGTYITVFKILLLYLSVLSVSEKIILL